MQDHAQVQQSKCKSCAKMLLMNRLWIFLAGLFLGIWFGRLLESRREVQRVNPVRHSQAAPLAIGSKTKPAPQPDSLTTIAGIGPAFEKALNALGIYTFAELARQNADDLAARLPARVTAERIRRDQWIEQAQRKAGEQS